MVDEIASLLDQCSPDELANILEALDGGGPLDAGLGEQMIADESPSRLPGPPAQIAAAEMAARAPAPPVSPPPGARRPVPAGVRKPGGATNDQDLITLIDAKTLLEQHGNAVINEVSRMMPYMGMANTGAEAQSLDLDTLTKVLVARDEEVKELESRLNVMHVELSTKDRRVTDLGSDLDLCMREVRHRQLDLEYQQLKLEETVRSNCDMEQAAKTLAVRVDEASLNARHVALDIDMGRTMPGMIRAQGALPWAVRKNRPAALMSGFV